MDLCRFVLSYIIVILCIRNHGSLSPHKNKSQWNPDLYYPGTFVRQPKVGACSLLTIVKFGLAQGESLKVAIYLFGGLFMLLIITINWLLGDNAFL